MGANKRTFIEDRIKCEMDESTYQEIPESLREKIQIKSIDVDYDYSIHSEDEQEQLRELKKESNKAFKKRKNYEYDLRKNYKK